MGKVTANLSISLDGFYTGPEPGPTQGLGRGGRVLHDWIEDGTSNRAELTSNEIVAEMFEAAGAMVTGRDGYDHAQAAWGPHPPFECEVFVMTHRPRPDDIREGTAFHFVDSFDAALAGARAAAGDANVALHGASAIRQALAAGALDELQLQIVPVLLFTGLRLFEEVRRAPLDLQLLRVVDAPGATHLKYRVRR
ncbi:MAG TPA: dihydrofolate reductase [Solirubrobacterales bacterium]|jgi:dihydrofolate reductase|nr:dihydrofolate reductase [Solirubrobacterales bacterium]